ncbi:PDZ domain-containing protein, partial [Longispora fulva]|uniref:PDZ domain-containing protein n=2 Tax=Bacteria TaxID=2 RepID=UPI0036406BBF
DVTASFPDSASVKGVRLFEERNGSIGGELLKRFNLFFDYGNNKLYLRKNKFFEEAFNYNMSGIILEHNGFVVLESYVSVPQGNQPDQGQVFPNSPAPYKKFELQEAFRIVRLRKNSPAAMAGLQVGDILMEVNGRSAYRYSLEDLTKLFSSQDGRRIKLQVERDGRQMDYMFNLKKML